ncbi:hypothetical protein J2S09_005107 [Bacillus fengqiuensis]|nr:hypothetical protein [Bacillus fengqiuensis]
MAVVKATESDIDLLARLLRAEAEGKGVQRSGIHAHSGRYVENGHVWIFSSIYCEKE